MTNWALVVGINEYPASSGQGNHPLGGAVADACDFAEWVLDPAGGNVLPGNLYFWAHPWPAVDPGRLKDYLDGAPPHWDHEDDDWAPVDRARAPRAQEIIRTAERKGRQLYLDAFGQPAETRRIYIFLAGHGLRMREIGDTSPQTCFMARNFRPQTSSVVEGLVPCSSFRRSLRLKRFDEVVMFFDCCRNDYSVRNNMEALPLCDFRDENGLPNWSLGNATADNNLAHETPGPQVRGAFSLALLDGLRHCRDPRTRALTVDGLDTYVKDNIARFTDSGQSPEFTYEPKKRPLVIVPFVDEIHAPVGLQPGPLVDLVGLPTGSQVLLKDGANRLVDGIGPFLVGPDAVQLPPLPDGLYSLEPVNAPEKAVLFKQPRDRHVQVS